MSNKLNSGSAHKKQESDLNSESETMDLPTSYHTKGLLDNNAKMCGPPPPGLHVLPKVREGFQIYSYADKQRVPPIFRKREY